MASEGLDLVVEARGSSRCPYCHDALRSEDASRTCGGCAAVVHLDCWEEVGRCPSCAWNAAPEIRVEARPEEPMAAPSPPRPGARTLASLSAEERAALGSPRPDPEPARTPGRSQIHLALSLQRALLLLAAGAAALWSAEVSVYVAGAALIGGGLFSLVGGAIEDRGAVGMLCALLSVGMIGVGVAVVDGLNVRASRPSLILFVTSLCCAAATSGVSSLVPGRERP